MLLTPKKTAKATQLYKLVDGKLQEIALSEIQVGAPAIVRLYDGRIVQTTPVTKWSMAGSRFETKNTQYCVV